MEGEVRQERAVVRVAVAEVGEWERCRRWLETRRVWRWLGVQEGVGGATGEVWVREVE